MARVHLRSDGKRPALRGSRNLGQRFCTTAAERCSHIILLLVILLVCKQPQGGSSLAADMQVSHASASAGTRPAYLPRGIRSGQPGCRSCGESQARQPARAEKDSIAERMPYNYVSSDGKKKATLEDAIMQSRSSSGSEQIQQNSSMAKNQPWNMGWQMSERNLLWNDDLAARLLKVSVWLQKGLHTLFWTRHVKQHGGLRCTAESDSRRAAMLR